MWRIGHGLQIPPPSPEDEMEKWARDNEPEPQEPLKF